MNRRNNLAILRKCAQSFYQCSSKPEFDAVLGSFTNSVRALTTSDCESYTLVLKSHDGQMFNLLNNFAQNFEPRQVLGVYQSFSGPKARFFPTCFNYLEFMISRSPFLEVLPVDDFISFVTLLQSVSENLGSLNRAVIGDKIALEFEKRMKEQLADPSPSRKLWESCFRFVLLNIGVNSDFILPSLRQYTLFLKEVSLISELEYEAAIVTIENVHKVAPLSEERTQMMSTFITGIVASDSHQYSAP